MILRDPHPDNPTLGSPPDHRSAERPRLNLLLSYGGWREQPTVDQLARLLEPMGICSLRADSGEEAQQIIREFIIHIAVVDLSIPLHQKPDKAASSAPASPGGPRILQLLRRLDQPPPTVVVRPPQSAARESARSLAAALREGAFAVLDRPVHLETMLQTMRRVLRRHYADHWPAA